MTHQRKKWTSRAPVIVSVVFGLLLWRNVLTITGDVHFVFDLRPGEETHVPIVEERIGAPVRIKIPSIAVDAAIEKVALAPDGSMDVPKDPFDTAWYEPGPRPGETGSAAITGHVDGKRGTRAVFTDLHKMRPGDRITVQDDTGSDISFVVRETRRYDASADAIDVFTSNDGKAHLNIITCTGAWDKSAGQYAQRLVVFTDRES